MNRTLLPPPLAFLSSLSLAALSLAFSAPAEAIPVNVNGTYYDITTYNGSYNTNIANECPGPTLSCLTTTPWWGNQTLADQIAQALFTTAPTPNGGLPGNDPLLPGTGPLFAWGLGEGGVVRTRAYIGSSVFGPAVAPATTLNYAVAVPLESDALPVVGAAAFMAGGIWWKKKRAQAKVAEFVAED